MNRPRRPSPVRTYSIPSDSVQRQAPAAAYYTGLHTVLLQEPIVCSGNDIVVVVKENISKNQLWFKRGSLLITRDLFAHSDGFRPLLTGFVVRAVLPGLFRRKNIPAAMSLPKFSCWGVIKNSGRYQWNSSEIQEVFRHKVLAYLVWYHAAWPGLLFKIFLLPPNPLSKKASLLKQGPSVTWRPLFVSDKMTWNGR